MKRSRGTVIPPKTRLEVLERDGFHCVCLRAGFPDDVVDACCRSAQRLELDHVRVGGMGMKSRSTPDNLVTLSSVAHQWKTEHGRTARPLLLAYLERINA